VTTHTGKQQIYITGEGIHLSFVDVSLDKLSSRPTGDLEWYDPQVCIVHHIIAIPLSGNVVQAITTANGKLVITLSETNNHDLNFQSGLYRMLLHWPGSE
jgi:hypothetical protein